MLARGTCNNLVRIPRVLVADDDARLRGLVVAALHDHCEVIEAVDGADALDKTADLIAASNRLPDAFVLDIRMPYLNGIHVMCALRGCDRYVPIVLTTAYEDPALQALAIRFGAVVIEKPFDVDALCAAVLEVIRYPPPATPSGPYQPRGVRPVRPVRALTS
ncbi:MAG: response regulator [Kofleriaceae bacterium]